MPHAPPAESNEDERNVVELPELWLMDVQRKCVEVRTEPEDGAYRRVETFRWGDSLTVRAFPDVTVAVTTIFEA